MSPLGKWRRMIIIYIALVYLQALPNHRTISGTISTSQTVCIREVVLGTSFNAASIDKTLLAYNEGCYFCQ